MDASKKFNCKHTITRKLKEVLRKYKSGVPASFALLPNMPFSKCDRILNNSLQLLYLVVLLSTLISTSCLAQSSIVCPYTSDIYGSTTIQTSDIGPNNDEISGIAFSPTLLAPSGEPVLYGINDGGNPERLVVWDPGTGKRLRTFILPGVENVDWEDLAAGPCGTGNSAPTAATAAASDSCLYIADTGDNKARASNGRNSDRPNRTYQMIKVLEPVWSNYRDYAELPPSLISVLNFDYSDPSSPTRSADSESIFLDHTGWGGGSPGDIYVVTKWHAGSRTRLFYIPVSAWQYAASARDGEEGEGTVYSPKVVGIYDNTVLTQDIWFRADMTADGTVIALGGETHTKLFLRCPGESVADALAPSPNYRISEEQLVCHAWPNPTPERQVESFAWTPDSRRTLQMTEGTNTVMSWTDMYYNSSQIASRSRFQACPDLVVVNNECQDAATGQVFAMSRCDEAAPTMFPTVAPSQIPTLKPSLVPTNAPTEPPSLRPSLVPTIAPTHPPSLRPSLAPIIAPTEPPSLRPSLAPTSTAPSGEPSQLPPAATLAPTQLPTSEAISDSPTHGSSLSPTPSPTINQQQTVVETDSNAVNIVEASATAVTMETTTDPTLLVNIIDHDEAPTLAPPEENTQVPTIADNMYAAALALERQPTSSPTIVAKNNTATASTELSSVSPTHSTKTLPANEERKKRQNFRH